MSIEKQPSSVDESGIEDLYQESDFWHVNTGGETIHAKRTGGRFRRLKWLASSTWLFFIFGPYMRWDDRQAVLFNIYKRQYHIFDLTIFPQDIWLLSLTLLFFAMLLAAVTAASGRIYCGFFCFQTVWTDVFTWLENKLEGSPQKRRKLDSAPWNLEKIRIKVFKHSLWIAIGFLTGVSFVSWFTDVFGLWDDLFILNAHPVAYIVIALFTVGTYVLAGFMREQACFWLCPYARIQGVMVDRHTKVPTYDFHRGETRGKLKKGKKMTEAQGDCIDCGQCVAVCPTGIDIRRGQQEGCITCALCLDVCDSVMDKINQPHGLIRFAALDEMEGNDHVPVYKHVRVLVYSSILTLSLIGIIYGLTHISPLELKVLHERQPLYVRLSDGAIQNKYYLKVLNKTDKIIEVKISTIELEAHAIFSVDNNIIKILPGEVSNVTAFVKYPKQFVKEKMSPVKFQAENIHQPENQAKYRSMFVGPRKKK